MDNTIYEITQERRCALMETVYNLDSVAQMLELDKLSPDGDDEAPILAKLKQDMRGHTISNVARAIRVLSGNLLDMIDEMSTRERASSANAAATKIGVASAIAQKVKPENERATDKEAFPLLESGAKGS